MLEKKARDLICPMNVGYRPTESEFEPSYCQGNGCMAWINTSSREGLEENTHGKCGMVPPLELYVNLLDA